MTEYFRENMKIVSTCRAFSGNRKFCHVGCTFVVQKVQTIAKIYEFLINMPTANKLVLEILRYISNIQYRMTIILIL